MPRAKLLWETVNAEQAATLHPSDLAFPLLEHLSHPGVARHGWQQLTEPREWVHRFGSRGTEVAHRVAAALTWMLSHGLLSFVPGELPLSRFSITREGLDLMARGGAVDFVDAARAADDALHPEIRLNALPALLRGDADTAVFAAMKHLEVAVRNIAGLPADKVGTTLMAEAFHPDNGPLRDRKTPVELRREREAELQLFMGAVGCLKNPASHRYPAFAPAQAYRALVVASFLLTIAESRASAGPLSGDA